MDSTQKVSLDLDQIKKEGGPPDVLKARMLFAASDGHLTLALENRQIVVVPLDYAQAKMVNVATRRYLEVREVQFES